MKLLYKKAGFTLIELIVSMGIGLLALFAMVSLYQFAALSFEGITSQTYSDMDAVKAMNRMIQDVRESKNITIISDSDMKGTFPYKTADGRYDRTALNPGQTYEYYLGDSNGNIDTNGKNIWKADTNGNKTHLISNVESLNFTTDSPRSVQITVNTSITKDGQDHQCKLTERVVYLRNY